MHIALVEPQPDRRWRCQLKELYVSAADRSQGVGRAPTSSSVIRLPNASPARCRTQGSGRHLRGVWNGLKTSTLNGLKSTTLRVTTVSWCTRAAAAIIASS